MIEEIVEEIKERLKERGVEVETFEIESRLRLLMEEYGVPEDEAVRSVTNYFLKDIYVDRKDETPEEVKIKDIKEEGRHVTIKGKILTLWESRHEAISQIGLIGDETGVIKFTKWKSSNLPDLEVDRVYVVENAVTDFWQGRYNIKLNRNTRITEIDEDIEVMSENISYTGVFVKIHDGSGVIHRCIQCNRSVIDGECQEHGRVATNPDLRIKAVMDDGRSVQDVLIRRELTERLAGASLDEIISEDIDVLRQIEEALIGKYFVAEGREVGRYLIVENLKQIDEVPYDEAEQLIYEAEQI
ncbi:MAG TPA: replication factor A [Candidatus Syntrophoarchaeum butanivorans]|uniref:Replication factor A n=1 Tax=Candidatus Syntropharchaeum butanivorans TaxID=1839936 RepID=A0A7C0X2F6_9EURY|nr:replication factor A [Candidatus Syntrophoarchaeum butanivorans]